MTFTVVKDKKTNTGNNEINVAYYQIFRYASPLEKVATILGVLLGFISGGGMTYNLIQIGELSTAFQERNYPPADRYSTHLPLLSVFGGGERLYNVSHEENMAALVKDATALAIGTFMSVGICLVFTTLAVWLINWSALRQITTIQMLFLKAVLRQDMYWFDTDNQFNLASMIAENITKLKTGMSEKLAVVSNLLGTGAISFFMAIPLGWQLALACATMMPLSVVTSYCLTNYQTKSSVRELESYSQAGKHAEEILKSVKTVVAFGGESKEVDRYNTLLRPAEQYGCRRGWFNGIGNGFNWVLTYCLNAIGLTYGVRLVIQDIGKSSDDVTYVVGTVFSVIFNVFMATQSITMSVPHFEDFSSACGAAASIFHIIERKPKIDSFEKKGTCIRRVLGEITLETVSFSYPSRPDTKVLNNFSIHIKPGEFVALVGSSGCGKSTIIQLLQRLYDPLIGSVKLDGKDLKNLNLHSLRSSLGVVGQEPVLFRGTVFENIAISCPEATLEEVQRVATMAYAHDFINKLPNGYNTVIGERGASLSGGQKQRIAIARSLLREPAVLLLDEATSALDPHSERQVQAALDRASVGRTTIIISHRLATIVNAQRIICMDKGAIVEQGTHEELMKIKGTYYKLVTTGTQEKLINEINSLPEVAEEENNTNIKSYTAHENEENDNGTRNDVLKKDRRKIQKHNSLREHQDWMTPRSSISSVVSIGYQNFLLNADNNNSDDNEDAGLEDITGLQILKMNAPEWLYITIGSIAAFAQGACLPAFAVLFGFTSAVFRLEDHDQLLYYADLYAGLFLLVASIAGICMCLQNIMFTTAGMKMTMRLRIQYFTALLSQEIGYYDSQSNTVGALCARLSGDTAVVQGATGIRIGIIMQGISSILIGVLMGFAYSWKLTLVSTAFLPLMVGSLWLEGRMSQKSLTDEAKAMEEATSLATEAVISIKTVQSLGIETTFLEKFQNKLAVGCAAVANKTRWRGLVLGMGIYVPFIAFCSAIVYGSVLVAEGSLDYKAVFLVTEAVLFGAYMLGQTLVYATSVNNAKASASKIISVINRQPEVRTEDSAKDRKDWTASGNFSINNIEFSYPTRKTQKVLKGIDLKVSAGKTVALVGSSGCGKSTVIQLMQRFYDPDSGTIELDGINTRTSLTLPRLRQQIGVVQQEPVLFDRTLAENIAYGDNNRKVDMHEIIIAAKAANIHTFINSLPKGYETSLGSGGAQLSGGQKQRICIARALIRSPRLLLLDEATSALDANSEKVVSEALDKAAEGRTCITIAHRLSTIQNSDLICVLDKGKIIERGNHEELIKMRGIYYRMCKGQNVA